MGKAKISLVNSPWFVKTLDTWATKTPNLSPWSRVLEIIYWWLSEVLERWNGAVPISTIGKAFMYCLLVQMTIKPSGRKQQTFMISQGLLVRIGWNLSWVVLTRDGLRGCSWGVAWGCNHFKAWTGEDLLLRNSLLTGLLVGLRKPTSRLPRVGLSTALFHYMGAGFLQKQGIQEGVKERPKMQVTVFS